MDEHVRITKLHSISISPCHTFSHFMPNGHESGTISRDRRIISILYWAVTGNVSSPFISVFVHGSQKEWATTGYMMKTVSKESHLRVNQKKGHCHEILQISNNCFITSLYNCFTWRERAYKSAKSPKIIKTYVDITFTLSYSLGN